MKARVSVGVGFLIDRVVHDVAEAELGGYFSGRTQVPHSFNLTDTELPWRNRRLPNVLKRNITVCSSTHELQSIAICALCCLLLCERREINLVLWAFVSVDDKSQRQNYQQ